jgi:voltage-gated potassium channel
MIRPHVVNFLDEMLHSDQGLRVEELAIPARFPPTRLASLRLRSPEYVLLAVRAGRDWVFNPGADYLLAPGQILIAMASSTGREEMEEHIREFLV